MLVRTMHFECKALASTDALKHEKKKLHNKLNASTYSMGSKIPVQSTKRGGHFCATEGRATRDDGEIYRASL